MSVQSSHSTSVIGLGSNLGERRVYLERAAERIAELGQLVAASALYESDAIGGPPQPRYLNAAILLNAPLSPSLLLSRLLAIESDLGRVRGERWGPRSIDLDLLWVDGVSIEAAELRLPHPRLRERAFALVPLLEVAPGARHPLSGEPYEKALGECREPKLERVAEAREWCRLARR